MLSTIISFILTALFIFLSFLHIYWALGGQWFIENTIPEKFKETFHSSEHRTSVIAATFFVAIGLMCVAWLTAAYADRVRSPFTPTILRYLLMAVSVIFLARAIGDFNMVGFFKKQKVGLFAHWDTKLFAPLCLSISLAYVILLFL